MSRAMPVVRGCGTREQGGVYAELGLGPFGTPVEEFLIDPPIPVDPDEMGITAIGVKILPVRLPGWENPLNCVVDWVGSLHYPNVADFVEEVKRFGLSRRLPKNLDFSLLTPDSRILLIHRNAYIANPSPIWEGENEICFRQMHGRGENCAGLHWSVIQGGVPIEETNPRVVKRAMPSFSYLGKAIPPGIDPEFKVAAFALFPIGSLVVIRDLTNEKDSIETSVKAAKAGLPVHLTDQ
jgi:hypothetical protein